MRSYHYVVDEHGQWFCEGNPVDDPELFRLLSRSLFWDGAKYSIRCEGEVHPVEVEDAPLWVRYVHPESDASGRLVGVDIELTDGRRELLDPETLMTCRQDALYCLATKRRLPARFGKSAYYELARYLQWDDTSGMFYLVVDGRRYDLCALETAPSPQDSSS